MLLNTLSILYFLLACWICWFLFSKNLSEYTTLDRTKRIISYHILAREAQNSEVQEDEGQEEQQHSEEQEDEGQEEQQPSEEQDEGQDEQRSSSSSSSSSSAPTRRSSRPKRTRAEESSATPTSTPRRTQNKKKRTGNRALGRPTQKRAATTQHDAATTRKTRMDATVRQASQECSTLTDSLTSDIEQEIQNPLLLRSLRALPLYLQQHNRCSIEDATQVYRGILLEALFRQKIYALYVPGQDRRAGYFREKFQDHVQNDNVLSSAYPEITSNAYDRQTFGYVLTDPENPCQLFYCCLHHGWQVKATREIREGTICTFYDGFKSMYRRCQTDSKTSSVSDISNDDWLTRSGEFSHALNLQQNHGMIDGKYLLPTDLVGFASFFNAHADPNLQFVYGSHRTYSQTKYFVAQLQAVRTIPQGSLLTANYNFATLQLSTYRSSLHVTVTPPSKHT